MSYFKDKGGDLGEQIVTHTLIWPSGLWSEQVKDNWKVVEQCNLIKDSFVRVPPSVILYQGI